ncbi:polysaccharide deacetylase family protein [Streptomyces sp. XM4011]|uniref:polysaccharide deacetylase family protein n=1 Tax=Streptomyces TaxID=1883 RepID=UPI001FFC107D|nr:polysaccharide deacetylase family protein [Streptomyces sp. XM4011]MCK1816334.1 polysaccharide deacetylase family protein [Streptomyces sp. XM4011]
MPQSRKPLTAVAGAAALALTLALTGCSAERISPESVREAADDKAGGAFGSVDCRDAKCIALTFDAGPGPYTAELLDILAAEEVPATLFLLGKKHIDTYPELVVRAAEEGHELANHTWTHPRLTEVDRDEVRDQLQRTNEAIEELTGQTPTLMRPPQGRTDDTVAEVCEELGLAQILWSVTAKDYQTTDSDLITERVLDQADRDGIILLHDIYEGTVPAVPGIIDALKADGYTFVTVSQLMAPGVPEPGKVYR